MNTVAGPRVTGTPDALPREVAEYLLAGGGQLVDVRSAMDFERGPLPGALNLPVDTLAWEVRRLNRQRPVILCGASVCHCIRAAGLLAGAGFSRIYYLAASGEGVNGAAC